MVSDYSDAGQARWLAERGIALLRGHGRLAGKRRVEVGGVPYEAEHVVLATGSVPIIPPIPGLRALKGLWTNREATSLQSIPRRLIVIGGGPVGVEMSQALQRLGAQVSLIEGADRLLPRAPQALGEGLAAALRRDGVELALGVQAKRARRDGEWYCLDLDDGRTLVGDRLMIATGRRPQTEDMGLETVGVAATEQGIPVDSHLRCGDNLWAIGDVNGIRQLTHVGKYQGEVVAANILGERREANYEAVPSVTFSDPQAAAVGLAVDAFCATAHLAEIAKSETYARDAEAVSGFLALISNGDYLTGAYALGPEAGEWLQQATLAIRAKVPLAVLADTIQPFPTFSEIYVGALKALRRQISAAPRAS